MALFTVRVELHGATNSDYEILHQRMERDGFSRTVQGKTPAGESGTWLLPTAEYDFSSEESISAVRDRAKNVADTVKAGSWVLVTKVAERSWTTKKIV